MSQGRVGGNQCYKTLKNKKAGQERHCSCHQIEKTSAFSYAWWSLTICLSCFRCAHRMFEWLLRTAKHFCWRCLNIFCISQNEKKKEFISLLWRQEEARTLKSLLLYLGGIQELAALALSWPPLSHIYLILKKITPEDTKVQRKIWTHCRRKTWPCSTFEGSAVHFSE